MAYDGYCDCYTNPSGYWVLGPHCREVERNEWRTMMNNLPVTLASIRSLRGKRINDVHLPEPSSE